MLESLGLTTDAELLYQKLLHHPNQPVEDIATELEITKDACQTALDLLIELGMVQSQDGSVVPISPDITTTILLMRQEDAISDLQNRHSQSQKAVKSFLLANKQANRSDGSNCEQVVGMEEIRNRIAQLSAEARQRIYTFVPGDTQTPSAIKASQAPTLASLKRGVESKSIYLTSAPRNRLMLSHIEWLSSHGAKVRTTPFLPIRMIIIDDKVAVLPSNLDSALAAITVEKSEGVVRALVGLFDKFWEDATPFGDPFPHEVLDETSVGVLKLLARGRTDNQISQEMHMSLKSVRRVIDDLEIVLSANNRFTLGLAAAKAGWI